RGVVDEQVSLLRLDESVSRVALVSLDVPLWHGKLLSGLLDGDGIAHRDGAAFDHRAEHPGAPVGGEGLFETGGDAVHQLAGISFAVDLDPDRADAPPPAERAGQVQP